MRPDVKTKNFKTRNQPEGREWPDEIMLDVGSNMPLDVYGCLRNETGVLYVRDDVVAKRVQEAIEATQMALSIPESELAKVMEEF
jgi:hypothetical protein